MDRFTKFNVKIQEHIENYIDDYVNEMMIDNVYFNNTEQFSEYFDNTEYHYFVYSFQVNEWMDENGLNVLDYLDICGEIMNTYDDEIDVLDVTNPVNRYIYYYIHENTDDLFKYYLNVVETQQLNSTQFPTDTV